MDKPTRFLLPSPNFSKKSQEQGKLQGYQFLTPSGMTLLARNKQPPPMYGPRGATVPGKYLAKQPTKHIHQLLHGAVAPPPNTPLPFEERQHCESCDIELPTLQHLRRHRAEHEKCPVEDCQYYGHPTVMDGHVEQLHASKLFEKFKKLNTPEEIAAWREERRKRYPTIANVQARQKAQEQKQKRGERIEAKTDRFGNREDRKRANPIPRTQRTDATEQKPKARGVLGVERGKGAPDRKQKRREGQKYNAKESVVTQTKQEQVNATSDISKGSQCGGVTMFKGTSKMKNYKHWKPEDRGQNPLSQLFDLYGSDDDEKISELEENTEGEVGKTSKDRDEYNQSKDKHSIFAPIEQSSPSLEIFTEQRDEQSRMPQMNECPTKFWGNFKECEPQDSSDEAPEEKPIARASDYVPPNFVENRLQATTTPSKEVSNKQSKDEKLATVTKKSRREQRRRNGLDYRKARLRKQNTMLEKLLEPEIRHERNVLLQCVRFVCEQNFFGIGVGRTSATS